MMQESDPMPVNDDSKSRALILSGGGLKVAYQAGVLQVWLDEAGVKFETYDGTSGGTFNLAMRCQGQTGTQIADKWRNFAPASGISPNWGGLLLGPFGSSVFDFDKYREKVFPSWDINPDDLPASELHARFNVFNFTRQRLESRLPQEMDEDILVACNSLPFWFPPVRSGDQTYLDAVYITDSNLEQAIYDGADELWVIWTVSRRGKWYDGFIAQYFQTVEEAANGTLRRVRQRIDANNAALKRGECGEFGRHIELRLIEAEVPLHYIMNLRRDRMAAAVELGVRDARAWCRDRGIPLTSPAAPPALPESPYLHFSETMRGTVHVESEPLLEGVSDPGNGVPIALHMDGLIDEIARFVTDPGHVVRIDGTVECSALGGTCTVEVGRLNLLTFDEDPGRAFFRYRLWVKDPQGTKRTIFGVKYVNNDPGMDLWSDTTTLHIDIWPGFRETRPDNDLEPPMASGQVRQTLLGFLMQQLTMKTGASNPWKDIQVRARFYAFFLGRLFDVYGQKVLANSPF